MSLSEEERTVMVRREYEKALQFYRQAEMNAEIELWDVVANRLYYSLFHGVCALLIRYGIQVSSHKGAVIMFGQHFVQTGKFETNDGRFYAQLQSMREKADYSCYWQVESTDLDGFLPRTKGILDKIKEHLSPYLD